MLICILGHPISEIDWLLHRFQRQVIGTCLLDIGETPNKELANMGVK